MDYQAILIAILGGSALTKTIDLIAATNPKLYSARKQINRLEERVEAWHQHWIRVLRWLNNQNIDTSDIPPPPDKEI